MSYSENGGAMAPFTMPVAPAYGGMGDGFGFGGNGAWWLIILLLFANNGWGFGGGYGNGMGNEVQRGFDQNAIMNGLNGINASINAMTSAQQNCCCENRLGIADLKYTVATEACADRQAVTDMGVSLMMNDNANTQRLIDGFSAKVDGVMSKICQLELDAKNDKIATLQAELNEANRRASQNDQTAQILASQAAQTAALEQYLAPTPRPAWIVQNPNCCTQNFGYGCGCGQ